MSNDREQKKAAREIVAFFNFVTRSSLPIILESVQSRRPPEPDILCEHRENGLIAFELVELCAPDIASSLAKAQSGDFVLATDPSPGIRKKLDKKYETPFPIELLIYNAGRVITPDNDAIERIQSCFESLGCGQFRTVWFSGEDEVRLIFTE